jgi:hypothetical protein
MTTYREYIPLKEAIDTGLVKSGDTVQINLPQGVLMFGELVVCDKPYVDMPTRISIRVGGQAVFYGQQKVSLFEYSPEYQHIKFVD